MLGSPLHAIAQFERARDLPAGFVNRVVVETGPRGAWARLERGELPLAAFYEAFEADCAAAGHGLCARALMEGVASAAVPRASMLEAISRIRARGLLAAALTNNWIAEEAEGAVDAASSGALRPVFDAFFESSVLGLQKPDPRIYQRVCAELAIEPEEAVFLDDIGRNLRTARQLGMTTIKVEDPEAALIELGRLLGFELLA